MGMDEQRRLGEGDFCGRGRRVGGGRVGVDRVEMFVWGGQVWLFGLFFSFIFFKIIFQFFYSFNHHLK